MELVLGGRSIRCLLGLAFVLSFSAVSFSAVQQAWAVSVSTHTLATETAGLPIDSKTGGGSNATTISSSIKSDVTKAHSTAFASSKINTTTGVVTKSTSGTAYYDTGTPNHDVKSASWSATASGTTLIAHSITTPTPATAPFSISLFIDPNPETGFDATFSNIFGGAQAPIQGVIRDNAGLTPAGLPPSLDVVLSVLVTLDQPPLHNNETLFSGTATIHPDGKGDFTGSFAAMGVQATTTIDSTNPGALRTRLSNLVPIDFSVKPDVQFDLFVQLDLSMGNPLDPSQLITVGSITRNMGAAAAFSIDTKLADTNNFQLQVVPEPASIVLAGLAILGFLGCRRRMAVLASK